MDRGLSPEPHAPRPSRRRPGYDGIRTRRGPTWLFCLCVRTENSCRLQAAVSSCLWHVLALAAGLFFAFFHPRRPRVSPCPCVAGEDGGLPQPLLRPREIPCVKRVTRGPAQRKDPRRRCVLFMSCVAADNQKLPGDRQGEDRGAGVSELSMKCFSAAIVSL